MDRNTLRKDFKNKGSYKTKIIKNKLTVIDSNSLLKLDEHLNKVTDTLFLGLSRGVRHPAMYTCQVSYNEISDSWDVENHLNQPTCFLEGVTLNKSGDQLQTLDLTVSQSVLSLTDSTPLYFAYNTSTVNDYSNNYVLFPRVSSIADNIISVSMEANNAGTWGYYESSVNGQTGLSIGFDCLLQTTVEHDDTSFYTPSIPDWTYYVVTEFEDSISLKGYVYNTIIETSETIDWECKVNGRIIEWLGDCASGSALPGATYSFYYPSVYGTGLHITNFHNLSSGTKYKIWVQIDSKIGPDSLTWESVGCFTTDYAGGGGGGKDPIPGG